MTRGDDNPFVPPISAPSPESRPSKPRLILCVLSWCTGVLLLAILIAADALTGNQLPGGLLYIVVIASPIITLASCALAPIPSHWRIIAFLASLLLMAALFVALGVLAFATSGMDGIH